MRNIRKIGGVDTIIIHLGVNDLKTATPTEVIKDLKGSILNLAQTSSAKIFYSMVLPVGCSERLNNNIITFNILAVNLINRLRENPELRSRIAINFNHGFTKAQSRFEDI